MRIRKFHEHQGEAVASLIRRNLLEVNLQYYDSAYIDSIISHLSAPNLIQMAKTEHILVAEEAGKVIGTGTLSNFGSEEAPRYYGTAIFVAVELHGKGIGKKIMESIEAEATTLGAETLTVRAARNARIFYERLGYQYESGSAVEDERGNYIMVKTL